AQETLPNFKVKDLGKQGVQVSWLNPFKTCMQLSVQRSTDSIQFKTILNAQTPNMYDNGFVDKAPTERPLYYRINYVLDGGKFYFSTIQSTGLSLEPIPSTTVWKPSKFVYCNGKGTPTIQLPEARKHLYRLVFKEENGSTIFEINALKETETYLDKANFVHTGWFLFDLYEDGNLKEQGKIFLQKDATSH
ncbi:MAG: hypothetical protein B7Y15_14305, partial [Bacteroidetes bacterium 24-39-8]